MSIKLGKITKSNVEFVNGSPYIKVNVNLDAKILSINNEWRATLHRRISTQT